MERELTGKVALVTSGSRGIGAAVGRRLVQEGADVVFSYASSRAAAEAVVADVAALARRATAFQADEVGTEQVRAMVRQAHAAYGALEIVVNSAGVFVTGFIGDPELDIGALDRQLDINLRAVTTVVRTAAPLMNNGGIVSIGTTGATHQTPFPGVADYVATEAAVAAYTPSRARDLGPRNIRANVIQPGPIDTGMAPTEGPVADLMTARSALSRYGVPEDVAATIDFLVGPEASYMTGATLAIFGDLTC